MTLSVPALRAQAPASFEAISIRESKGTRLALQVTALEEQLGLKAESTRAVVEVTVFDRLERPAPD